MESVSTDKGRQEVNIISEPGFYFFLNRSDKPAAMPMQLWIAGEILPSIRKTGAYSRREVLRVNLLHRNKLSPLRSWRQKQEGRRLDIYAVFSASWQLQRLSDEWNCSVAAVVERLVQEADERYENILFPETE